MLVRYLILAALTAGALPSAVLAAEAGETLTATATQDQPLSALPYTPSLDPESMDRSVNPCQDFYQFSCGGWRTRNPIPPDQSSWSVYGKLYDENQRFLWGILQGLPPSREGRSASQQKIGDYFASCMDEQHIDGLGAEPLQPTLAQIDALKSKKQLRAVLAGLQMHLGGSEFLFEFTSGQDFTDSSQVIAFARAGGLGLPDRDYYTDQDAHAKRLRAQYRHHIERMYALLGAAPEAAARNADIILAFETALAQASLTAVAKRDPHNLLHKLDRKQLRALVANFAWDDYLKALDLGDVTVVNVQEPRFFAEVSRLLARTSLPELKIYLKWHALNAAARYLSSSFSQEQFAFFQTTLRGTKLQQPRWKRCVRQVDELLGEALGQEFVARTFGPALKSDTQRMASQIEEAMRQDINELSWMGKATKQQALQKLAAISNKIGYPDHWRDYSALSIRPNDYFGNFTRATEFESLRQLAKIGQPLDRGEWQMTPPTVNAYYDENMNDINFPAGVLQPPLYDSKLDDAPNYGNTGGTIGHELTHAFDDEGHQYDSAGNLRNWWSPADAARFKERTECIVDQYAQYVVVDDIHINSRLTLGEDIADLGGLILAHMAWKVQTAGQTLTDRDGLTPEQRFYVGYAQWACSSTRDEAARLRAKTDPHSPARYRVNGLMVNLPEFQQAFSCKIGDPMVAQRRCRVW